MPIWTALCCLAHSGQEIAHRSSQRFYIPQRGVQWKQGVVIDMTLYTSLLYKTTPIHCTPYPLHPPLQSIQR